MGQDQDLEFIEAGQLVQDRRREQDLIDRWPEMQARAAREARRHEAEMRDAASDPVAREAVETTETVYAEIQSGIMADIASLWQRIQQARQVNDELLWPALATKAATAASLDAVRSHDPGDAESALEAASGRDLAVDAALTRVGAFSEGLTPIPQQTGNPFAEDIKAVIWKHQCAGGRFYDPKRRAGQFKRGGNAAR